MPAPFRIGLIGLGNVGGALARRLVSDADAIAVAARRPILIDAIAVARHDGRQAPAPLVQSEELLERRHLDAVVELIGGLEPAYTYISTALKAGRQVVTANKQVIAASGPALAKLGPIRFEASVGSAIPIVEMMAETLAADRVSAIVGILNGTTNSMLGAMAVGASYEDALADAQQRGMAEADPSADVDAHDPAAKLAILSMLGFRQRIEPSQIERIGIRKLERQQLEHAALGGCVIKLIAAATFEGDGVAADVRPRMLARTEPIAAVDGAMNAVALDARYAGHQMLTGAGAGPDAAASAVLADLIRAARDMPASAGALLASLADMPTTAVSPLGEQVPYPAAL